MKVIAGNFQRGVVLTLLALLAPVTAFNLNLEKFAFHRPDFFVHSLDVELHDDLALVTGYGGLMIYRAAPDSVVYVNRYLLPGNRLDTPFYNSTAFDTLVFATGRDRGLYILNIADPQNPTLITRWFIDGVNCEEAVYHEGVLAVSAHRDGLYFLDVSHPDQPQVVTHLEELGDCWTGRYDEAGFLFVADGTEGLAVVSFDGENASVVTRQPTVGQAVDLKLSGMLCAVACGAEGVELYDVSNPEAPALLSRFDSPTYAGHIAFDNGLIAVADWSEVLIYDVTDPHQPTLTGRKTTEYRSMGVELRDSSVYLADWSQVIGLRYGEIAGPDIDFSMRRIFPRSGDRIDTVLTVFNNGHSALNVSAVRSNAAQFAADPTQFQVDPGGSVAVSLSFTPEENQSRNIQISSNDRDESRATIVIEKSGGLRVGDPAPDFSAPLLGGGTYNLAQMAGRIQLLIFWASW